MRRTLLLALALAAGSVQAASVKLRPQGADLTKAVRDALAALSTKETPVTLDTSGGPLLTVGGSGPTAGVAFNPDVVARTVTVRNERRIELNPQGPLPLAQAIRSALGDELGLSAWTPEAARTRLSGADLNGDGVIDLVDLALLMNNFGKIGVSVGDLNQDRKVDDADLRQFAAQYKP